MLKLTKILDFQKDRAYCTLVEYKDIKILLDCGINEEFDTEKYDQKLDILKTVDLILLSSSRLIYSGAIVYLLTKINY